MLLTIDVGNTNTVLGMFEGDEVVEHWRIATDPVRTADEIAVVLQGLLGHRALCQGPGHQRDRAVLHRALRAARDAGDVPPLLRRRARADRGARRAHRGVGADGQPQGGRQRPDHEHGGRGAPLRRPGAWWWTSAPRRTSTRSARRGEFVGGALAPGIEISVDALSRRAAQLLKVELARPQHVIGKNTVEALQSGIIFGFAGQVEGIARRMAAELAPGRPRLGDDHRHRRAGPAGHRRGAASSTRTSRG